MSLEQQLAELTEAVKENTAVHREFAEIARKASTGKSSGTAAKKAAETDSDEDEKAAAAEAKKKADAAAKRKAAAAKKKAEAEKAKEAESDDIEAEIVTEISDVDLRALAKDFMSTDDEDERDANKEKFASALKHLGAGKLSEVSDDEDRSKLATYIKYWQAGETFKFRDLDEKIGGSDDDDDMLD